MEIGQEYDPRQYWQQVWPLVRRSSLSAKAKLCFEILSAYAGQVGPSASELASGIGAKERCVRYILAELKAAGLVRSETSGRGAFYVFLWPDPCNSVQGSGVQERAGVAGNPCKNVQGSPLQKTAPVQERAGVSVQERAGVAASPLSPTPPLPPKPPTFVRSEDARAIPEPALAGSELRQACEAALFSYGGRRKEWDLELGRFVRAVQENGDLVDRATLVAAAKQGYDAYRAERRENTDLPAFPISLNCLTDALTSLVAEQRAARKHEAERREQMQAAQEADERRAALNARVERDRIEEKARLLEAWAAGEGSPEWRQITGGLPAMAMLMRENVQKLLAKQQQTAGAAH